MRSAPSTDDLSAIEQELVASRQRFLEFVRARVADPELAEDILQDALVRAVESADTLRDRDRLTAWFYRVLRNAIIDAYRRRDVRHRHSTPLDESVDLPDQAGPADDRTLCECFRPLLATLKPEYAEVLEALDLGDATPVDVASRLGITTNNLNVRRHRARAALRERLQATCRVCAAHGCLDCTCPAATGRITIADA